MYYEAYKELFLLNIENKNKTPFYKKWWVWVVVALIVFIAFLGGNGDNEPVEENNAVEDNNINEANVDSDTKTENDDVVDESVPREHISALKKAQSYAENMDMSKLAIYDQLVSEYGEQFPEDAAQYAINTIEHDWKENALKKAQSYAENMDMSKSAIYEQLISEYGEKFTQEEAQYAIDNLD